MLLAPHRKALLLRRKHSSVRSPRKRRKNNNFFDNMAFYDSVSVIAGRAIVTIDPLPEEKPIVQQPTRKLRWQNYQPEEEKHESISKSVPAICEMTTEEDKETKTEEEVWFRAEQQLWF
jgi:hypothetical protein